MSAAQYRYTSLDTEHQIRLLRLHHNTSGPLTGDLITHTMNNDYVPAYKAVSYVWGDPQPIEAIMINGNRMPLPRNAIQLLQQLRATEAGFLWIDVICINQTDVNERNHQVQKMREIYSRAEKVVFYLGPSTADTALLFRGLDLLHRTLVQNAFYEGSSLREYNQLIASDWNCIVAELGRVYHCVRERQRLGLRDILSRRWFRRVWIVQEVALARDGEVRCGSEVVASRTFVLGIRVLQIKAETGCRAILSSMPTAVRPMTAARGQHLYEVLLKHRKAEATDDRDNIYGLLGLCTMSTYKHFMIDYGKSPTDIVREAIAYICCCELATVPPTFHPTMRSFLSNLPKLDESLFNILLQSTANGAVVAIKSMLAHRRHYIRVNSSMMDYAAKNACYGEELLNLLRPEYAEDYLPMPSLRAAVTRDDLPRVETMLSDLSHHIDIHFCLLANAVLRGTEGAAIMRHLLEMDVSHINSVQEVVLGELLSNKDLWLRFASLIGL